MEPALSTLEKHFVVGWKNNKGKKYVGSSHGYTCDQPAVGTTNGAGPRNMQTFVLAHDGTVLHCLPGFWHPEDLAHELSMARALYRLWQDKRPAKEKRKMFSRIQLRTMADQPRAMVARSTWQGFDAQNERRRAEKLAKRRKQRDTWIYEKGVAKRLKPTCQVVRERMAARPLRHFNRFDVADFVDYGRPYYDNNARVEGAGVDFNASRGAMASQKRMQDRKKARAAAKQRKKERGKRRARPTSRPTSRPSRRSKRAN